MNYVAIWALNMQKADEDASFSHLRPLILSVLELIRREAVTALQIVDALHVVGGQLEVEDVVVLGDVGGIGGAGDGDGAALQVPAEDDLIGRLLMGLGDGGDDLVLREGLDAGAATAEGEPGFEDGAKTGDVGLDATALVVGVRLVLQHGGTDGRNLHHAVNIVLVKVRETDAAYLARLHATLHGLIGLLVVGCRVVEQQQVYVVESKALQPLRPPRSRHC